MKSSKMTLFFTAIFGLSSFCCMGQEFGQAAKIDQFLKVMLAKSNVPGFAIAVVTKDSVLFLKGYGASADGQPVTPQTPFAIASLSKAFTAMSIMQLMEAHKITLTAPVISYIPNFEMDDPRVSKITIEQLLHQTSGLNDQVFPELSFQQQPASLDESIYRMKSVKLGSNPGEQFRYHNPNYQILAKVVESVAKQPFPQYVKQQIFDPLGVLLVNRQRIALRKFNLPSDFLYQLA